MFYNEFMKKFFFLFVLSFIFLPSFAEEGLTCTLPRGITTSCPDIGECRQSYPVVNVCYGSWLNTGSTINVSSLGTCEVWSCSTTCTSQGRVVSGTSCIATYPGCSISYGSGCSYSAGFNCSTYINCSGGSNGGAVSNSGSATGGVAGCSSGGTFSLTLFGNTITNVLTGQSRTVSMHINPSVPCQGGAPMTLSIGDGYGGGNCPSGMTCTINTPSFIAGNSLIDDKNVVINSGTAGTGTYVIAVTAKMNPGTPNEAFQTGYISFQVVPPPSGDPDVVIESPSAGASVSNTVTVSGWALDNITNVDNAINQVRVLIDGVFVGNAGNYPRADICATYNRTGCPNVGYRYDWDTTAYSNGSHTIRFEATDTDITPRTSVYDRTISVNNVVQTYGTIQGYKTKVGGSSVDVPPAAQTITLNGGSAQTINPFNFSNIIKDSNYSVSVSVPSGWSVGYTLCYGNSSCHSNTPTAGNIATVNIPSSLTSPNDYASLWWHFTEPIVSHTLTVDKTIGGSVTSVDGFINCGSVCSKVYQNNTDVTLVATPASVRWKFVGWSGDCSGTGACDVRVNSSKVVKAQFRPNPAQYQEF